MRRHVYIGFLGAIALGLVLYLPLLSGWYDLNGIPEARGVETGRGVPSSPNHMLYQPVGFLMYQLAGFLGYSGPSAPVLQVLTALFGALGLGFVFLTYHHLSKRVGIGLAVTAMLATSWAYWSFSTDISYIVPAAAVVAAALAIGTRPRLSTPASVGLGLIAALAVLFWQANVFLIPTLAAGLLWTRRARLPQTSVFVLVATLAAGLSYVGVGIVVHGQTTPLGAVTWALRYGGASLPTWGHWSLDRLPLAVIHQMSSVFPLGAGMRLDQLTQVLVSPRLDRLAIAAVGVVAVWLLVSRLRGRPARQADSIAWLLLGYLLYFVFIVWWDPQEPKWFIIPNILLGAILAILLVRRPLQRYDKPVLLGCVAVVAASNFFTTIWPRHAEANPSLATARCISERMSERDIILAGDWSWDGYVTYFYRREVLLLVGATAQYGSKEAALTALGELIRKRLAAGNRVFISDMAAYSADYWTWLTAQTGFRPDDFAPLATQPAFDCNGVRIRQVMSISSSTVP
ncbi:MAG: hypothetical protein EPO21_10955 [Chloroflexota bacterium]|nr:MAG: hypothetical protein EPO21_10955 [Chloroflexota bacterium]